MDRLLVMRGGALGDFVLGLPALRALREAFPQATLELVAPAAVLPLASPLVDVATPLERAEMAALFVEAERLPEEIVNRYRHLDLVVLWLSDADGSVRRNFQWLGARRLLWAPALPTDPGLHATDHLLETLRPLGIDPAGAAGRSPLGPQAPLLQPGGAARERAAALARSLGVAGRPVVAIHPGSGGDWKRWPPERFALAADRLAGAGHQVALIQGPADSEAVRQTLAWVQGKQPPVVADLRVEDLAAFLALCACYLGNDSGVTHLAAAVGTPTVAIFGPTDPAVWGPRGRRVVVLRAEQECAPCTRERAAGCGARPCLEAVSVEQVARAVETLLRDRRR